MTVCTEPETANLRRRPKRRWLSFRLRSLLLLTLTCAMALGYGRHRLEWYVDQEQAAQDLIRKGIRLDVRIVGPDWARRWLGDEYLVDVVGAHLERRSIDDSILESVSNLRHLERLYLAGTNIDDEGLEYLRPLRRLRRLSLWHTKITDAGLARLKHLKQLTTLDVHGRGTEGALEHLRHLPRLQTLIHSYTVGDRGARWLAEFPALELTGLATDGLSDQGLEYIIGRFASLESLALRNATVSDAGIKHLQNCTSLSRLAVQDAESITDKSLAYLPDSCKRISFQGTNVTLEGIADHFGDVFDSISYDRRTLGLFSRQGDGVALSVSPEDSNFRLLGKFTRADTLELYCPPTNGTEWLEILPTFSQLQELLLTAKVDENALRWIGDVPTLKRLRIGSEQNFTSQGLRELTRLRQLEDLDLSGTGIRSDHLQFLRKMPQLLVLNLSRNPVSEEGMAHLSGLERLQSLSISECREIGDAGLVHLRQLESLIRLEAHRTKITDEGLEHLYDMPKLQHAIFVGSQVSPKGLQQLRAELPTKGGVVY